MGVDPCISSVCAALIDNVQGGFGAAISQYAPTSFVSRRCTDSFVLEGHAVQPGDLLYLSLVKPNASPQEYEETQHRVGHAIPFGAGPHLCVGRPLAIAISNVAEKIYRNLGRDAIGQVEPVIGGDGAFLSIKGGLKLS
jgi:hypothetical protein